MTCSTMSGVTGPKLLWIIVWILPSQYASYGSVYHNLPTIPPDCALRHRCRRLFMPRSNHYILMTADTRVRTSGDMDK
jgi:hypothetical protein